jgi:hypothetical protein
MLIQGICGVGGRPPRALRSTALLPVIALLAAACSTPARAPDTPDFSSLPPQELLNVFLQDEQSRGAVKFSFNGVITVTTGEQHRFRGVAGYEACHALRMQLVGPVGVTLLDYLNVDGRARIVVDKMTPDDDAEARAGLADLLEVFTLALVDRCHDPRAFEVLPRDAAGASFAVGTPPDRLHEFILDRVKGVVTEQKISGGDLPGMTVEFGDYGLVQGYWMPATIAVRTADLPVSIDLAVSGWQAGIDLPDAFFVAD